MSVTWVKGSHTYKLGADWRIEGNPQVSDAQPPWSTAGSFTFAPSAPNLARRSDAVARQPGFSYASFLVGKVTAFGLGVPAVGHPGGVTYEATCHCRSANHYPYAVGPRFGVAYQVLPRTVLRGGIGLIYNVTNVAASTPLSYLTGGIPGFDQALFNLQEGVPSNIKPTFPNFSPGALPLPNTVGSGPVNLDPNAGRPARQLQWSFASSAKSPATPW